MPRNDPRPFAQSGAAYEPPARLPPDPAEVAASRHEADFVKVRLAQGVSWFNLAKMTGRTAPYLQATYG